jgi:uncharacterized protein YodC (DUF2158 family)
MPHLVSARSHQQSKETTMTFAPGDIVALKSGGHSMTVASVDADEVDCLWLGDAGELFRQLIPAVALTVIESESEAEDADDDEDEKDEDDDDERREDDEDDEDDDEDDEREEKRRAKGP